MVAYHTNKIFRANQQHSDRCNVNQQAPSGAQAIAPKENPVKGKARRLWDMRGALLVERIHVLDWIGRRRLIDCWLLSIRHGVPLG